MKELESILTGSLPTAPIREKLATDLENQGFVLLNSLSSHCLYYKISCLNFSLNFHQNINRPYFRYIPKLCELFHICEDLGNSDGLKSLFSIARSLFMLNRNSLIEIILSEEYFRLLLFIFYILLHKFLSHPDLLDLLSYYKKNLS